MGGSGLDCDAGILEVLRTMEPGDLPETDLASVPQPFRWWVNTYGVHTPAALIHDRFLPSPLDGVTDAQVDRYFRFMLQDLGVRWAKRWLIWAAVAFRFRLEARGWRRWSLVAWAVLALVGSIVLVWAIIDGNGVLAAVALVAPLLASALWGQQAGAGLIAAYFGFPLLLFRAWWRAYSSLCTWPSRASSASSLVTIGPAPNRSSARATDPAAPFEAGLVSGREEHTWT